MRRQSTSSARHWPDVGTHLGCLSLALTLIACGDQAASPDAAPDAVDYTLGAHPALAMSCNDVLADLYVLPTGLPAMDDSHRGDVFRCAESEKLTVPEIRAQIEEDNRPWPNATPGIIQSGFWTYRVAYRTMRNTVSSTRAEGDTAAVLLIPAKPIQGAPLIVWGHGSTGLAEKCAPSRLDLSAPRPDQDYPPMLYRLAGYGFPVIAPDYAGFSYGQPPGYFNAEDEAHAVLDATRAAAQLLPNPPDKVVFVGHSQGGHAVLSAHSYASSYGMHGTLVGVAVLAPMWSSMSLWAAATSPAAGLMTSSDVGAILYAMAYAYSAGELRTGDGESVFQPAKQAAAVEAITGGECYDAARLQALGNAPADFFDSEYVNNVGTACAVNPFAPDCTTEIAAKWKERWLEDRPAIDARSAPILVAFGAMDTFVTPGRAGCARAKLDADLSTVSSPTTTIEYCMSEKAAHRDIIRGPDVDYVVQWIAAKAGGGSAPAACRPFPASQVCATPPNEY